MWRDIILVIIIVAVMVIVASDDRVRIASDPVNHRRRVV